MSAEDEERRASSSLNVLVMNTVDLGGGAARAALRLSKGLRARGHTVRVAVQRKESDLHWVLRGESKTQRLLSQFQGKIDAVPGRPPAREGSTVWSNNWFPNGVSRTFDIAQHDLLHLHWVGGGFFPIRALEKVTSPIVWTLHDMWPFTGGCHYSANCERFLECCGCCPELGSASIGDLSARNVRAKMHAYGGRQLQIVSPSNWLAELARRSSLFRNCEVRTIPNGIDLKVYRPIERVIARSIVGLPQSKRIVLFGAADPVRDTRKGYAELCQALQEIAQNNATVKDLVLVVFGASEPEKLPDLGIPVHFTGKLQDDATLACVYSSADILVVPSKQENLANTIMEGMACGVPTVAFEIGGNSELIDHLETGYLVKAAKPHELAAGILHLLGNPDLLAQMTRSARRKCEVHYDIDVICRQYESIYFEVLKR